jgi:predicted DsbA family dithiol-disulfide isomerase
VPILDEAARRFGAQIAFQHHAFELRPEPVPLLDPRGEYIQEHWRNRVGPMATERGLVMRIPPVQTRTRRAHETAAFARVHGQFEAVDRALFQAFFEDGLDINNEGVLVTIVSEAGLDGTALRGALEAGEFAGVVQSDLALAARLGLSSVPTMLVADEAGAAEPVVGAVPYEHLEAAIERAQLRIKNQESRIQKKGPA